MKNTKKKIGIMGGTFNPIHLGHLILAENAYETMALNEVWVMPTAMPPHKQKQPILDKKHRLEMVRLAIQDNPHFRLSMIEMDDKLHYSYETMEKLRKADSEAEYFYILGADSLLNIEQWVEFRRFLASCHLLAAVRSGKEVCSLKQQIAELTERYEAKISMLSSPNVDISSSDIRFLRKQRKSVRYYVPKAVYDYMEKHQLYLA